MPGPYLSERRPFNWQIPETASVMDSPLIKALRMLAQVSGMDSAEGQIAGLMSPMGVPDAQGVAGGAQGAVQRLIKAYHGSPHDFEKFSTEKIGTGEGAQAYGHGLYFAENPEVAADYRKSLANPTAENPAWRLRGEPVALGTDQWQLAQLLDSPKAGEDAAAVVARRIAELEDQARFAERAYGPDASTMYRMQADRLRKVNPAELTHQMPGKTYEVNIHADPETFLDWDKPLSQQGPTVQQAVKSARDKAMGDVRPVKLKDGSYGVTRINADGSGNVIPGISEQTPEAAVAALQREADYGSGQWVHDTLSRTIRKPGAFPEISIPDKAAAAKALHEQGIPGIKYLDQGSRSAGEGSRNYVVFDDNLISILRKYGLLAPASAPLLNQAMPSHSQER